MDTLKSLAIMLLMGEILIAGAETPEKFNITLDYTHCKNSDPVPKECATQVGKSTSDHVTIVCFCTMEFTLSRAMSGPVTLFYTLPEFNQTRTSYAKSLDEGQLAGNLTMNVSSSCGNFSYDDTTEKKPIAPCGEIADSYFFDQFTLFRNKSDHVPDTETGLDGVEEVKKKYRNPPGDLKTAFQNFAKPKSWSTDVTSLNNHEPEHSGFQNERFIAWMNTDLKIKPAKRFVNTSMADDGLPAGKYKLRILYYYSEYITGPRIVIISSERLATKDLEEAKRLRSAAQSTNNQLNNKPIPVWAFLAIIVCILQK